MRKIILDFDGMETREEVQEYLAEKFEFPDYYGRNLDALYDCLTAELTEETGIILRNRSALLENLADWARNHPPESFHAHTTGLPQFSGRNASGTEDLSLTLTLRDP